MHQPPLTCHKVSVRLGKPYFQLALYVTLMFDITISKRVVTRAKDDFAEPTSVFRYVGCYPKRQNMSSTTAPAYWPQALPELPCFIPTRPSV